MRVTITCTNLDSANYIHDLLTDPSKGQGSLVGSKYCYDDHPMVPDILEFDLNETEIKDLSSLPEVINVNVDDTTFGCAASKITQTGIPRLASYTTKYPNNNSVQNAIPHSLYYCQNFRLQYTQDQHTSGALGPLSLPETVTDTSTSCPVDILILDSGIDITHPDFFDASGKSRVVLLDWTQFKEYDITNKTLTKTQIVSKQSSGYYQDINGHGTACASLVTGNRCGLAKNARIFVLRGVDVGNSDGFTLVECLKLALSFHYSKINNVQQLVDTSGNAVTIKNTTPTVFLNSYNIYKTFNDTPVYLKNIFFDTLNRNLMHSVGAGKADEAFDNLYPLPGQSDLVDSYLRAAVVMSGDSNTPGSMHVVTPAGNSNWYLTTNTNQNINLHVFSKAGQSFAAIKEVYAVVRTTYNNNSYVIGQEYNGYKYLGTTQLYSYSSPYRGIGSAYTGTFTIGSNLYENYPVISVGDVSPIGFNDEDSNVFDTGGVAKSVYTVLSGVDTNSRILFNNTSRYSLASGPYYVKSPYSNFGPLVDIYAPGNGCWAACSNDVPPKNAPNFVISKFEKYIFFNGTSAAASIAAGALATYVGNNPGSATAKGKTWLLTAAVVGNILETQKNYLGITSYNGSASYDLFMPFGSDAKLTQNNSVAMIQKFNTPYDTLYRKANLSDVLFHCRFFDSANLFVQAFPLREAVVPITSAGGLVVQPTTRNVGGTTLINPNYPTTEAETHTVYA
jgi:Subtilase family